MARVYDGIDDRLGQWIAEQPMFFVATAPLPPDGHINISPKGIERLHIVDERTVCYLDRTGSGVETIAHLRENGRIVIMCCSFEGPPRIVRLHGNGDLVEPNDPRFEELARSMSDPPPLGTRAVILVHVTRVADSCGYGVPVMHYADDRENLDHWAATKGPDGIAIYQRERNAFSIDGLDGLSTVNR
jgi:hypothetical protein